MDWIDAWDGQIDLGKLTLIDVVFDFRRNIVTSTYETVWKRESTNNATFNGYFNVIGVTVFPSQKIKIYL